MYSHGTNWLQSDLTSLQSGLYLPPLYLQHDGHSRTIVGYDVSHPMQTNPSKVSKTNQVMRPISADPLFNLYVFDPSSKGEVTKKKLLAGNGSWRQQLKRGLHTFKKKEYQVVYVEEGIMSNKERNESKIITSERINGD